MAPQCSAKDHGHVIPFCGPRNTKEDGGVSGKKVRAKGQGWSVASISPSVDNTMPS